MTRPSEILAVQGLVLVRDAAPRSFTLAPGARADVGGLAGPGECELFGDVLQGLAEPFAGSVRFLGGDPAAARARVGRVFCGNAFVANLTVAENLRLAARFAGDPRAEAGLEARLAAVLAACGVPAVSDERPAALSDADRRFWQWVRALSRPRDLFIVEGPDSSLAPAFRAPLRRLLDDALAAGAALVSLTC